jgi:dihydroxyacetone kinase-like protein
MPLTAPVLAAALSRCADRISAVSAELNALDGQLGDGDLGATLEKCAANVRAALPGMAGAGLAGALQSCAMACAKASGSSFGTLLAVAFMAAARHCAGRDQIEWNELPGMMQAARDQMMTRGKAALGDKTVLDALTAAIEAQRGLQDPAAQGRAAQAAVAQALAHFRRQPNRVGRARMFAEKSIGLDDPGMIAFAHLLAACCGEANPIAPP